MINLIVRTSKSLLPDESLKSNLGDLLRSTILCSEYKEFLFLTDEDGGKILKNYLKKEQLITLNKLNEKETYNLIYLDNYDWCYSKIINNYKINENIGFRFFNNELISNKFLDNIIPYKTKNFIDTLSWQENLIYGLNLTWKEQKYLSPIKMNNCNKFKIGLNWKVPPEWKTKQWEYENWQKLYTYFYNKNIAISWQEGLDNIQDYIEWISSCEIIVTIEGLGLHIASSLNKKIILLSGPCYGNEYNYNNSLIELFPQEKNCLPCNTKTCFNNFEISCLEEITPLEIIKSIELAI